MEKLKGHYRRAWFLAAIGLTITTVAGGSMWLHGVESEPWWLAVVVSGLNIMALGILFAVRAWFAELCIRKIDKAEAKK